MTKPKDTRTYIRLHDGMPDHPKVEGLSDSAFRLLIKSWCWCSRNLTDGRIPAASWKARGSNKARTELIAAGLVEPTVDGVLVHDYTVHQRTADEVTALRNKRSESGRSGGKAKAANALANGVASARAVAKQTPSKDVAETEAENRVATDVATSSVAAAAPTSRVIADPAPAQRIVAAYVEGATNAGLPAPAPTLIARVGKQAKAMLAAHDVELLTAAAAAMGAAGWHDLAVQVQRTAAEQRTTPRNFGVGYRTADDHGPSRVMTIDEWATDGRSAS